MRFLDKFKNLIRYSQPEQVIPQHTVAADLSGLKVTELKALAKERGIKGYSTLKKADLLSLLNE